MVIIKDNGCCAGWKGAGRTETGSGITVQPVYDLDLEVQTNRQRAFQTQAGEGGQSLSVFKE